MPKPPICTEDQELFREAMRTVKPLGKSIDYPHPIFKKTPARKNQQDVSPTEYISLSNPYSEEAQAETVLSHGAHCIPKKRFTQLRQGKIRWDARLDLHGMHMDAARDALCRFISQQLAVEHRCLLIIHGKGGYRGEPPVLKNCVNHWLKQLPEVLAFHSAQARDGGNGALYVLLRRQRT